MIRGRWERIEGKPQNYSSDGNALKALNRILVDGHWRKKEIQSKRKKEKMNEEGKKLNLISKTWGKCKYDP